MAEIIAICNQKGGVGKTTTSINLSAALAAAEKRTLLIDLDSQGNATTGLGFDKHKVEYSIYNALIDGVDITSILLSTDLKYLKVVPSNTSLVGAEVELVGVVSRETRLKHLLQAVDDEFDYIIIDTPPSLGLLTLNALSAANSVIVPVQCEYYALEGIADLQRTISLVQDRINPELKIFGIVLTMFDSRNNLSHQVLTEVKTHFKEVVFHSVIPRNVRLSEAPSYGKPILLYDVNSKGAVSYFELAKEVLMSEGGSLKDDVPADTTQNVQEEVMQVFNNSQ
ncbi:MAG: ParA family protein [Deltaproteobacteria bacterium]|jgi:chromosome partitioning protein|nr:ParA family protein [Deltaproteobacteria bacterium]